MARGLNRLSARSVQTMNAPGRHADGGGLYLVIDDSGARRWVFLYRLNGKRREMGLGGAGKVTLAIAREKAGAIRAKLAMGIDPIEDAEARNGKPATPTFADASAAFIADNEAGWKNETHREQWRTTLATYCQPINAIAVDKVDTAGVLACLRPIWQTKPETASRVRGRIERVLNAAKAQGFRSGENPAAWRGHLASILPKAKKLTRGHHKALHYDEVPAFVARLREREAVSARMLELIIITAARSGEARNMRWQDVNGDMWTVPDSMMKAGRAHRVPLVPRALELIGVKPKEAKPHDLVFPNQSGRAYSDAVFQALFRRLKVENVTAHGFRSSFKDWGEDETTHGREVIEAALAHVIGDKAEQAYRRTDAIRKRRALLHDWYSFVSGSKVGSEAR